ncbi:calcium uniporter protein, mitochondrial-like [Antedon mediterranea]|uniref:calcium uniporter protein, mitochondrial-like n=1 Tax=Antedon mediterranea TaxID=105859 RepID=UPI003AF6C6AA
MTGRMIVRDICFRFQPLHQIILKKKDLAVTPFRISSAFYCTTSVNQGVTCHYRNGLPVLLVPLPSRQELCQFTLKPITENVGDFINHLKREDGGVETVAVYSNDGIKIAKSTSIDVLMKDNFQLKINENSFEVSPPETVAAVSEDSTNLSDVKSMVYQLYSSLHVEEYQLNQEKKLVQHLEDLKLELQPLEKIKLELDIRASKRTNLVIWGGLGYMALQFGLLARLTWWEYSWDIVEPITYFVTYGSAMALYSYYVLTKEDYTNPGAADRQYLKFFHRFAKRKQLDIATYNSLKDKVAQVEQDLRRLRDPLALHLPIAPPLPQVEE